MVHLFYYQVVDFWLFLVFLGVFFQKVYQFFEEKNDKTLIYVDGTIYSKIDNMNNTDFDFYLAMLEVYVFLGYLYYISKVKVSKMPKMPKNDKKIPAKTPKILQLYLFMRRNKKIYGF